MIIMNRLVIMIKHKPNTIFHQFNISLTIRLTLLTISFYHQIIIVKAYFYIMLSHGLIISLMWQ